jgi:thiamine biosynthesis protein ThiS
MRGARGCQTQSSDSIRMSETQTIEIVLNGESRQVGSGLTVLTLLSELGIDPERVAVEMNREIIRQPDWPKAPVGRGAQVEIVQFVGGG